MIKKYPHQEDLNKLLKYYQNKQYDEAQNLALLITQKFPENQYGWKALGAIFEKLGKKFEALKAKEKMLVLSPKDAEAHFSMGVTFQQLGRLDEAEEIYKQAIVLNPNYAEAFNNLGIVIQELGRPKEAEKNYKKAITLKADYVEAYINLGVNLKELGRYNEVEVIYRQAIELKPDYADAYNNLGNILKELGRLDEAEKSYRQAVALKFDYYLALNNLGITLQELGRLDEAEESFREAIKFKPNFSDARYNLGVLLFENRKYTMASEQFHLSDNPKSKLYQIRCSYLNDEKDIFYEKLDSLIHQGEINAVIGSLIFCSEIRHGIKKSNPFCSDPLSYVIKSDLNEHYDFENVFIKTAKDILMDTSVSNKSQGHLTNGTQTSGNIFIHDKIHETKIEDIIHNEIEKYRIFFSNSEEGFIKKWPTSYDIYGWLVSMQSGGKLDPHMHDIGWLTGSIYINVPEKSTINSGNLVLCPSDKTNTPIIEKNNESIIDVMTGSLCLFPSSLHHYTIPFEEEEDRIVLAFDIIPK